MNFKFFLIFLTFISQINFAHAKLINNWNAYVNAYYNGHDYCFDHGLFLNCNTCQGFRINMSYAIEFNHLTKRFGNHTVLDDLNFNIHEGKITTILGFSGAGKSTVLKHILGIYHPT